MCDKALVYMTSRGIFEKACAYVIKPGSIMRRPTSVGLFNQRSCLVRQHGVAPLQNGTLLWCCMLCKICQALNF